MIVFVVGGDYLIEKMFKDQGWDIGTNVINADLVQFTGGSDVSPHLYGEETHPTTMPSTERDEYERAVFKLCKKKNKPMAGICRGSQFLNVMCGGKMWQDVNNHCGNHEARVIATGDKIEVTSTHHQMWRLGEGAVLLWDAKRSTYKHRMEGSTVFTQICGKEERDPEAAVYPADRVLCVQGHPEYMHKGAPFVTAYFKLLDTHLFS